MQKQIPRIKQTIKALPTPPDINKPHEFNKNANTFVNALPPFAREINQLVSEQNELTSYLSNKSDELLINYKFNVEEINAQANLSVLKIQQMASAFNSILEQESKKRLDKFTNLCLEIIESKGYEMLAHIQDNGIGADYMGHCEAIARNISLERFMIDKGFIKLSSKEK